jgi:hypothetical protein
MRLAEAGYQQYELHRGPAQQWQEKLDSQNNKRFMPFPNVSIENEAFAATIRGSMCT